MSCTALPIYHVVPHAAHADVVQMCFRYISVLLTQKCTRGNVALLETFPMLSYVLSSGFNHIAHVDSGSMVVIDTLQSLGSDVRHHPSHWDRLCELREEDLQWPYPPWPSSRHDFVPYMLVAYSSSGLLESFLSTCGPLKPRVGTNPLVYAADLRKTEHAMALLTRGANTNMRGMVVDDSRKALPLDVAIDIGDDVLVGELLQRGCVVTSEVLSTAVCMPWCSTRVLIKLVATPEFEEWANEIGDEKLYRCVFNSARPNAGDSRKADEDHVALARRLRQIGQDLSPDSLFGVELIERALHAAHATMLEYLLPPDRPPHPRFLLAASTGNTSETVSVVRFLLRRGADINTVSVGRRDTALHLAAMCPWEPRSLELTQMLINNGCNLHARNLRGETALTVAVQRGHVSVVEHLLSYHVSSPLLDILPTALQLRSTSQMVRFLIRKGADIHSTTSDGDTLLHLAVAKYVEPTCLELVKSFIAAGFDTTTCNSGGKSVFQVAIERDYISVVEYLLSCNVPLPVDILPITLQNRSTPRMVEFLICKGAEMHSTMCNGDTILHLAIAKYVEPACLELVKSFIAAGFNTTACNSEEKPVFQVAIERDYISVVEYLLSCNVPLPADILPIALQNRSTPQMVESLIRRDADVHSIIVNGDTVLHLAVANYFESTCLELVKSFIAAGFNPTTCNSGGKTIFQVAYESDYSLVVEYLLSRNDPFPPDILPIALQNRSTPEMLEFLVRKGANVNPITTNGDTVLHLAIAEYDESTCLDLVNRFIGAGCNPVIRNSEGKTAFDVAIERGYNSVAEHLLLQREPPRSGILSFPLWQLSTPQMVKSLIRKAIEVRSTPTNSDTVLHLAIATHDEPTCLDLVKRFIRAGCNPTTRNSAGKTVFEVAVKRGYGSVAEHLLLLNDLPRAGILSSPLWQLSTPQMIKSLIRKAIDMHSTTENGDTVLHLAIATYDESTYLGLVKRLVEAGCSPTICNSRGKTVFEVAIERGYTSVVEHLLSCNVSFPPNILLIALRQPSTSQMIQVLIRSGADVNSTTSNGDTVLHLVVSTYHIESTSLDIVKRFIEAGCGPTTCNSKGKTVLEVAIKRGYTLVVERLLLCNVPLPPNILPIALQNRSTLQMVEFLIRKGVDVNSPASSGDTVLHLAVAMYDESSCLHLVDIFIDAGCNPMAHDSHGETALEAVMKRGYATVTEYLLLHNVPIPPVFVILSKALQQRCIPRVIGFLARQRASDIAVMTESHWDTLLQFAYASYIGRDRHRVLEVLNAGRNINVEEWPSIRWMG